MLTETARNIAETAAVDAAIEQVLQAEQAARDAVNRCGAEAELRVAQAREQARRIAERAALRSARVHDIAQARLQARLEAIDAQRTALDRSLASAAADAAHLRAVIERLAAELTTEST
jgi:hypothetical protein